MEVTDENLATLANYLQQTLNPDPNIRRPAEKFLEGVEVNQNYAILLLHLIDKDTVDLTIRIAGAVAFKNYIKRNWPVEEDGADNIHANDRAAIKGLIVSLMLKSPEAIQRQFSDAVSIIGKYDFPQKWPGLISEMVEKFATGDFHIINGVLRTAHSLFKKYRFEFKSQPLWEEIKHVLENFAKPLTDLFVATIELTSTHSNNPQALRVIYGSLVLICKVFYSLNYQDLPEFFEDNMPIWMPNLLNLLQVKVPSLEADTDDDKPGVMEQLRTEVCECAALYALKYEEEFHPHAPGFVTAVWTVLLATGPHAKYDALVSNALTFLAKVAEKKRYQNLFEDPNTLSSICEKVVIPNMEFRESDMELFEDNPEEYVRRDMEGSDVDTRGTQAAGVTKASPLVDLASFAAGHVLPELQRAPVTELPVLKADAIKYILTFRSLLPKEFLVTSFPLLIEHISGRGVVCTYAACTVEKLVAGGMLPRAHLEPHAPKLLTALFAALGDNTDPADHNEYVMKAILRTLSALQESALPFVGDALPKLARMLAVVAKNPCKPHFNHYLFETLSLSVSALFPIFQEILQNDVQEFMPYVFQMLSLLLELRGAGGDGGAGGGGGEAYGAVNFVLQNAMLGVFQKLIASKTNDHEGFYLVQTMLYKFGSSVMDQYCKQIITLLFQRLSSSKTTKFVRGLIAFLGFYAAHFGADTLVQLVDSVQANMFAMYTERVLVPELQRVSGALERKAAAVGCVKLLTESQHFLLEIPLWTDFQVSTTNKINNLIYVTKRYNFLNSGIDDPKRYLAESLGNMCRQWPDVVPARLAALDPPHRHALQLYLNTYGVHIC
ncbi:PREDICTED: exportin-2 [Papilio polytes]|uniref:exportin-2 n=1 Tax=Papilio polytes TaxID=76194 RepID=UPI0006768B9B|nr:PREDICTED: exportin-2 [Papilio polytes]